MGMPFINTLKPGKLRAKEHTRHYYRWLSLARKLETLEEALLVAELVENTDRIYVLASLLGKPNLLPPEVVEAEQKLYRMMLKTTQG